MVMLWKDKTVTVKSISSLPRRGRGRTLCSVVTTAQLPVLEKEGSRWLLWLSYDHEVQGGVRLVMYPDGSIKRENVNETGTPTQSFEIAPKTSETARQKARR